MNECGFVYIASISEAYYNAAVKSAISLKDNFPEANITLFTHEIFLKEEDKKFFDNIVTGIPVHIRAKMWGMARTPYQKTLYVDADTEIRSERITEVFDILKDDKDILFTKIINHVSADKVIDKNNNLEYHGGIILYNNNPLTIELMNEWYELYLIQRNIKNWNESIFKNYNKKMQPWDQFTIWYLLQQEKYKNIKHDFFPKGGHEFNYIYLLEYESLKGNNAYKDLEQIIFHYTIPKDKVDAGHIKLKSRTTPNFN
jgi:hypothetical protein